MATEKLLYKEGVKIPVSNERQDYVRAASRELRAKFKPKEKVSCNIELQKQMLEKLYTDKKEKTIPTTNPNRIK